jgi:hypothetical protein
MADEGLLMMTIVTVTTEAMNPELLRAPTEMSKRQPFDVEEVRQ